MSEITFVKSASGFLYGQLDRVTSNGDGSQPNNYKITGRVIGDAALLVASAIETVIRYAIASVAYLISFVLKGEQKENFVNNYVNPAFVHAKLNKNTLFLIKGDLVDQYELYMKPFLQNKVGVPS